ncbi:MAG: GyrI-like domain-containing protein [Propionibacteriaceae bacterium]|jgi:hypothetical protein|nr:GyrI-like domain-containing protein [Propionibacteriaceae bacterium]
MTSVDIKKVRKDLYSPTTTPTVVDVPAMAFIMVDGQGDPNTSVEYSSALEILYGLSYSIKMSKMGPDKPEGYYEYVVAPLEGLWSLGDDFDGSVLDRKNEFQWTAMIGQPKFVTDEVFAAAQEKVSVKKGLDVSRARLTEFYEGLCAQILHIGPYDDEPRSIATLNRFISDSGYRLDISATRRHHEIYLGDPRKTAPEKLKTIIRHPIATISN